MRIKVLLATVALGAVALTATAQVYSVNAVGFINVDAPVGLSMIANQLDNMNGNKIADLIPSPPESSAIYKFAGTFSVNTFEFGEWTRPDETLLPGEGAFFLNAGTEPFRITFVGEVPQGDLKTSLPAGLSIVSSQVPQAGKVQTDLGYPAAENDRIYRFVGGSYSIYTFEFGEWAPEPEVGVGEGFWVQKEAAVDWTRTFSVNQ